LILDGSWTRQAAILAVRRGTPTTKPLQCRGGTALRHTPSGWVLERTGAGSSPAAPK
jgi:hypothetical protein